MRLGTARQEVFLRSFLRRADASFTAACFSGRFIFFQPLIWALVRPQLTQTSPLSWQTDVQGLSMGFAISIHHPLVFCQLPGQPAAADLAR